MASGNQLDFVAPERFTRENGPPQITSRVIAGSPGAAGSTTAVTVCGVPLRKLEGDGYQFLTRLPSTAGLGTGLTFTLYLVDDPNNSNAGATVDVGITVKRLVSGTDDLTLTSAATEKTFTQAMDATVGQYVAKACAIVVADLPASLAAGDLVLVRLRRLGANTSDTHQGTVLVLGMAITDT